MLVVDLVPSVVVVCAEIGLFLWNTAGRIHADISVYKVKNIVC